MYFSFSCSFYLLILWSSWHFHLHFHSAFGWKSHSQNLDENGTTQNSTPKIHLQFSCFCLRIEIFGRFSEIRFRVCFCCVFNNKLQIWVWMKNLDISSIKIWVKLKKRYFRTNERHATSILPLLSKYSIVFVLVQWLQKLNAIFKIQNLLLSETT